MSLFGALEICEKILESKKYSTLYKPLILRICEEEYKKYSSGKERIKAAKNTLHAMYGAYLSADCFKKAGKYLDAFDVLDTLNENKHDIGTLENILRLHASTKERMKDLRAFYSFIFDATGPAESILDIGCGFNPFTLSYFPQKPARYHSLDIDTRIADLNNRYFAYMGLPQLAGCVDIVVITPEITVDVAFLFKLLPLIDRQARGRSAQLLREIDSQYLVVTYPTKSLTGKEKGMQAFYAAAFEELIGGNLFVCAKKEIGTEMVYIIKKAGK